MRLGNVAQDLESELSICEFWLCFILVESPWVILPSIRFSLSPALIWGESNASSLEAEKSDVGFPAWNLVPRWYLSLGGPLLLSWGWDHSSRANFPWDNVSVSPKYEEYKDLTESVLEEKVPFEEGELVEKRRLATQLGLGGSCMGKYVKWGSLGL